MTTTIAHSKAPRTAASAGGISQRGFSLVELMFAMAIASALVAMVCATVIGFSQWSIGLGNYLSMNQQSRTALEVIGRDFRMASLVNEISDDRISLSVPTASGGTSVILYELDTGARTLTRTEGGDSRVILETVNSIDFRFFNVLGVESDRVGDVKVVQVNAEMQRSVRAATNTNYPISARFTMRNKVIGS